jgi:hypothetical protein
MKNCGCHLQLLRAQLIAVDLARKRPGFGKNRFELQGFLA